eukprot:CAMPEP_0171277852 /NCGR_PEP_ID=MMETSP0790-20130122/64568_1 /TAXON_ID=2925 /ORGANISM="Alexandrium catenella, Strain OF101" /LENGTH=306 /DNA_ID=CAMNT_0011746993 /DNA_START=22 /DNA_END=940 /DNA_ORIENTATION=-
MAEEAEWDWAEQGDAESFIAEYEPDETAANALRSQSSEVVLNVLSQGPLVGSNPSAILMSRIREACACAATDVDSFLEVVDDSARGQFMAQDQQVMDAIMEEGPLTGNNPSAILVMRIRKARQSLGLGKAGNGSKKSTDATMAARRRAGELGGGGAGGPAKSSSRGAAPQRKAQQKAPQQAQQKVQAQDSGSSWPQGDALQNLASLLCQVNSAMWDFDVPHEEVVAKAKEALKARRAAVTAVVDGEWPEDVTWDFDVPHEDVVAKVKEALKARKAAVTAVVDAEWPEEWAADDSAGQAEPPRKRAR